MTAFYKSRVEITLEGPFLMEGLGAKAFGVDAAQLRDDQGRAVIPAGQVRGILRQAMDDLTRVYKGSLVDWPGLLGDKTEDDPVMDRNRGSLSVTDLTALEAGDRDETTTRVSLASATGAAKAGHLLTVEAPARVGEKVTFAGWAHFPATDQSEAATVTTDMQKALRLVPAIGADKTVGLGIVSSISVGTPEVVFDLVNVPAASVAAGSPAVLRFTLDRPLMVAPDLPEANVLQSASQIPGSVLKGALARKLTLAGHNVADPAFSHALSRLRIGHATPSMDSESAYVVGDLTQLQRSELKDGAGAFGASPPATDAETLDLSHGKMETPPAFKPDAKKLPSGGLEFDPRTRVGIDPNRGSAKEGELFTHVLLRTRKLSWHVSAEMPQPIDPAAQIVWDMLCQGLFDLGKTRAVTIAPDLAPKEAAPGFSSRSKYKVTLLSPAHICRTEDMVSEADFTTKLCAYWEFATGGSGRIAREAVDDIPQLMIFAEQRLVGGVPAAARRPFGDDFYEPLVLTEAESAFVLEPTGAGDLEQSLTDLVASGLPRPPGMLPEPDDHRRTVHMAQNGFGEIRVEKVS